MDGGIFGDNTGRTKQRPTGETISSDGEIGQGVSKLRYSVKRLLYDLQWPEAMDPLAIEMSMCKTGGTVKRKDGSVVGNGLFWHWKRAQEILWPEKKWHRWNELQAESYLKYRTLVVLGPASCVHGDTLIFDPIRKINATIREWCDANVHPFVETLIGPCLGGVPFLKGKADLFLISLENGNHFRATAQHQVMLASGAYAPISSIVRGAVLRASVAFPLGSTLDNGRLIRVGDAERWKKIDQGSQSDCPACLCSDGERPHLEEVSCPDASPSQVDALKHTGSICADMDDLDHKQEHNHLDQRSDRLSNCNAYLLGEQWETFWLPRYGEGTHECAFALSRSAVLSRLAMLHSWRERELIHGCTHTGCLDSNNLLDVAYKDIMGQRIAVSSISWSEHGDYYDLHVPVANHYFAHGVIHHNSGKTNSAATDVLFDYYLWPSHTSVIICSTTKERLQDRIFGEIKKFHRLAQERYDWLPGHLIEGRLRIVTDDKDEIAEGRDFRNGIIGVACKLGNTFVGISEFAGIKNKRVRLVGDELSMLPRAFVDAISNLDKNEDFKCVGLGNPKEVADALGVLAEPSPEIGGWDGGIDQSPGTKTWKIRRPEGICVQLVGSDSPNLDGQLGIPLIDQKAIDRDVAFYGKDSLWFTMMNEGKMPRGQGSHRILTRQMCLKFHACEEPIWRDSNIKKLAFMDAGYGGDRCVFGELNWGRPSQSDIGEVVSLGGLANNEPPVNPNKQIIAIVDTVVVPVVNEKGADLPEDQIVRWTLEALEKRGIPLNDFFYEPGQRTKLTTAFNRIAGGIGNPVDCLGKAMERPIALGQDVLCVNYYHNLISQLWYQVRMCVESGQLRGLKESAMWEFGMREWGYVGANKIQVEPKPKMREKTGRSPDESDAIAIGIEGAIERGFEIVKTIFPVESKLTSRRSEAWKSNARIQARKLWHASDLNYSV